MESSTLGVETRETTIFPGVVAPDSFWAWAAARISRWAEAQGVVLRDVIVLLPFAALVAPAHRAFARRGGWMPRVETPATLAASLGPAVSAQPGQISFDPALDKLRAAAMLDSHAWAHAWARRDARGYNMVLQSVVSTAHEFARAAAAVAPPRREEWWQRAREVLSPSTGPGATELMLARVALEWAALGPAPFTDRLFNLSPTAWVGVRCGGPLPLVDELLASAQVPVLHVDADIEVQGCFGQKVSETACNHFEDEAQAAAACVLQHLQDGHEPVALIAQDRLLTRRIRALLARRGVPMSDETGWKLSTTRAAAVVMSSLRAARPNASTDELLEWLKAGATPVAGLDVLEEALRRHGRTAVRSVAEDQLDEAARGAWRATIGRLRPLIAARRQHLDQWLAALRSVIDEPALAADAAGQQVLAALYKPGRVHETTIGFDAFVGWVDATLENGSFVPVPSSPACPVVITPLPRAILRPFGAVVLPAADEKRLGRPAEPHPLLGDGLAVQLGLPGVSAIREAERLAFAQLLRVPRVTLLRRQHDGDEPLAVSPLVERLTLARRLAGLSPLERGADARAGREVAPAPLHRPAPAPGRVPLRISMSAVEALRDCPYRFFSRALLGLGEPQELDDEPDKRDFGIWLHAVLHDFHAQREPQPPQKEIERLLQIGEAQREVIGIEPAAFLPYAAAFERFAQRYVAWQHERDASGLRWVEGEAKRSARPAALAGVELHGRLDRIDRDKSGAATLLDYKTGSVASLRNRVRDPLEDTQLALYALISGELEPNLRAAYLALDDPKAIVEIEHDEVAQTARQLLEGLSVELEELRRGAGLPALGEGQVCEHCEARGLCRKDDWQ